MIIDFNNKEVSVLPNFKGGEKQYEAKMFADDLNRVMHGRLVQGASIGQHIHDTSSEIIYVLSGTGHAIIDGCEEVLTAGMCHYCPKGSTHTLRNDDAEDLIFFAVVPQQ